MIHLFRSSSFSARLLLVLFTLWTPTTFAQSDTPPAQAETQPAATPESPDTDEPVPSKEAAADPSDADRILNMRRLLTSDRRQKEKLEAELVTLEQTFEEAAADFERIDERLATTKAKLEQSTEESARATLNESLARQESARRRARNRFEMVIDRRKAVQQQIVTLTEKIALETDYLQRLSAPSTGTAPAAQPSGEAKPATGADSAAPAPSVSLIPGLPLPSSSAKPESEADAEASQRDEDLKQARREESAKAAALRDAEDRVNRLERAIDVFERDLVSTRELFSLAQQAVTADTEAVRAMEARLKERRDAGELEEELRRLTSRLEEVRTRLEAGHEEARVQAERVAQSEATLARLKKNRAEAVASIDHRESDLRTAERRVWFLSSPIAPYQVSWWFTNKGPRVVFAIIAAFALYWIAKLIASKFLGKVLKKSGRGDAAAREGRAETLRRVFDSSAGVVIIVFGILTALNQAGVNVTVLLGGAAVIGAAIAFGSQNLIKDYFSGFMILMENQYSVGNVVKVGAITGTVENITLRMTSLRDLEGVLHFIPHSQVLSVSNLTYGWSRIVMDIKVNGAEDPDKVMESIMRVARQLKGDPQFGQQILGEAEMLGVDQIGGAAMVIKVLVKTKPLFRWPVKREMLRRIKKEFDAAGIKMA